MTLIAPSIVCMLAWARSVESAVAPLPSPVDPQALAAPRAPPQDAWTYRIEPYVWLVNVDGRGSADSSPTTSIDVVGELDSAFLLAAEARAPGYGPALLADWVSVGLEDDEGSVRTRTDASMLELGFTLPLDDRARVETVVGARWVDVELELDIGGVDAGRARSNWVDPIVGARGAIELGENWELKARGDIGGFGVGSDFSWQGSLIAAARLSELVRLDFGYRAIAIDVDEDDLEFDGILHGAVIGLAFEF